MKPVHSINFPIIAYGLIAVQLLTASYLTNLWSWTVSATLALILAGFLLLKTKTIKLRKFDILALFFVAYFNMSFFYSTTPYGYKEFITFNFGFLLYFLLKNYRQTLTEKALSKKLFTIFVAIITLILTKGLITFLSSPVDRFSSLFLGDEIYTNYPNVLAVFLLFLIPLIYLRYRQFSFQKNRFQYLFYLFSLTVSTLSFWLTSSRTAFLALALFAGLMAGFQLVKTKNLKTPLFLVLFALLTFILALTLNFAKPYNLDLKLRLLDSKNDISADASLRERAVFFQNSLHIGLRNFSLGTGSGSFQFVNPTLQTRSLVNSEHPHNIFLKLFTENGAFALIAFLGFLLALIFFAFKKNLTTLNFLSFFNLSLLLALLFASSFDYNLGFPPIALIFFYQLSKVAKTTPPLNFKGNYHYQFLLTYIILVVWFAAQLSYWAILPNRKTIATTPFIFSQHLVPKTVFSDADYLILAEKFPYYAPLHLDQIHDSKSLEIKKFALLNYLNLNFYNNFEAHYVLLTSPLLNHQKSQPYLNALIPILKDYNQLLKVNAHHTVATSNPNFVNEIYKLILTDQLQSQYQEFLEIWQNELDKFHQRYL